MNGFFTDLKRITGYHLLYYGFPLLLAILEILIRMIFKYDIMSFVGPSLAAGSLGFIVDNIQSADDDPSEYELNLPAGKGIIDHSVRRRTRVSAFVLFFGVLSWVFSCVWTLEEPVLSGQITEASSILAYWNWSFGCGVFNYLTALVLAAVFKSES